MIGWKHESSLMPVSLGYVLHIGRTHAPRVSDNGTGVAAVTVTGEDAEKFHVYHHSSCNLAAGRSIIFLLGDRPRPRLCENTAMIS
jgi:hypothetical protein